MQTEPSFNYQALGVYFYIAQWLFNIGLAVWVYFRNADSENSKSIDTVAKDLDAFIKVSQRANDEQNIRFAVLQNTVAQLPDQETITLLRTDMADTKARLKGLDDLMRRVEASLHRIESFMLENK